MVNRGKNLPKTINSRPRQLHPFDAGVVLKNQGQEMNRDQLQALNPQLLNQLQTSQMQKFSPEAGYFGGST